MILHLVNDEKIINRTVMLFDLVSPGENLFVVFGGKKEFRYVKESPSVMSKADFLSRKGEFEFSSIVIHLLNTRKIRFINKCGFQRIPVYWIIWGADLYNKLLAPKGFEMYYREGAYYNKQRLVSSLLRPFALWSEHRRVTKTLRFIREHVSYIVTDTTENDYDVFLEYFPEMKTIPWRDFFYYPIDEILGKDLLASEVKGNSILIGNSCSLTNNHEYALDLLSKLDLHGRKIIVPLSYSVNKAYRHSVIEKGQSLFGEYFNPLIKFLPLDQYNGLMTDANIAIYGSWRQEAIGNIIIALYLGAKVFISGKNPVFAWAKNHGLKVFELEKISQDELDTSLDIAEKSSNRKILLELYNKKRLMGLIRETFRLPNEVMINTYSPVE